jgi:hypothetical protein
MEINKRNAMFVCKMCESLSVKWPFKFAVVIKIL